MYKKNRLNMYDVKYFIPFYHFQQWWIWSSAISNVRYCCHSALRAHNVTSSGVATGGGGGGQVGAEFPPPPLTAKKLPKAGEERENIGEKQEKRIIGKTGKIGKKGKKLGWFFHFAPPRQIGLATLLVTSIIHHIENLKKKLDTVRLYQRN